MCLKQSDNHGAAVRFMRAAPDGNVLTASGDRKVGGLVAGCSLGVSQGGAGGPVGPRQGRQAGWSVRSRGIYATHPGLCAVRVKVWQVLQVQVRTTPPPTILRSP